MTFFRNKKLLLLMIVILGAFFLSSSPSSQSINFQVSYKLEFDGNEINGSGIYSAKIKHNDHPVIQGEAVPIELLDGRILFFAVTQSRPFSIDGKTRSRAIDKFFMTAFGSYQVGYSFLENYEKMLSEQPSIILDPSVLPKVYISVPPHLSENLVEIPHENLSSIGIKVNEFRLSITNAARTNGLVLGFLPWLEDPATDWHVRFDLTMETKFR